MSDHFGRLPALRTVIAISMVVTPVLYLWRADVVAFYPLLCAVYYCYGTQISVYTALAGDFWGTKYLATNYGVLLLAWGCAGVAGPYIGSHVFQSTGSYRDAFFGAAGLACVALIILGILRTPRVSPLTPGVAGVRAFSEGRGSL
jgi:OFA family oxalate/formate antiporter-like MFS transporter